MKYICFFLTAILLTFCAANQNSNQKRKDVEIKSINDAPTKEIEYKIDKTELTNRLNELWECKMTSIAHTVTSFNGNKTYGITIYVMKSKISDASAFDNILKKTKDMIINNIKNLKDFSFLKITYSFKDKSGNNLSGNKKYQIEVR